MPLVIKKKVSLDFLGEEYKDGELVFKSIPAKDLPDIISKSGDNKDDTVKLIPIFIEALQKYFIEGSNDGEAITKEDIGEFDAESALHCFQILTGQKIDPKSNGLSTNTSSTEVPEAQK